MKNLTCQTDFFLFWIKFRIINKVVVISTHIAAIAIPTDTDPCSNSLVMNVDTVSTFGGDIIELATSSLKEIMNVIMAAELILGAMSGRMIFLNI